MVMALQGHAIVLMGPHSGRSVFPVGLEGGHQADRDVVVHCLFHAGKHGQSPGAHAQTGIDQVPPPAGLEANLRLCRVVKYEESPQHDDGKACHELATKTGLRGEKLSTKFSKL